MQKLKNRCLLGFAEKYDENRLTLRLQDIFFCLIEFETPFSCYSRNIFCIDLTMCISQIWMLK